MNRSLPAWATALSEGYRSDAASQFLLHGNVGDRMLVGSGAETRLGDIAEFLSENLLGNFDIILSYDLGNGLRVEKGREEFATWPGFKEIATDMPRVPRAAAEILTRFFRYVANLPAVGGPTLRVALIFEGANLAVPNLPGGHSVDVNAVAMLVRDWSNDPALTRSHLATFLLADALNDLHPLLASNPRAMTLKVPLPSVPEIHALLAWEATRHAAALAEFKDRPADLAAALAGLSLAAIDGLLKIKSHRGEPIGARDLSQIKKELVEKECGGLISFLESRRTLDDVHGLEAVKKWVRQDIALWLSGDIESMPMGYLLCGPVGTGKTFLVECIAGEAQVPVVKINNFRDKWMGTTEGNLEKIFRLLAALGKCFVFVDEADQSLGRRDSGADDGGLSGRVYSMFAQEMSNSANRGRILWILATSRPDLVEVDLKRPGRIDVKIPIFPTSTPEEGFSLIRNLCRRNGVEIPEDAFAALSKLVPDLLTPGAANALAVTVRRATRTDSDTPPVDMLRRILSNYQAPVPRDVMEFQIGLAASEASDLEFVPEPFRRNA